MSLRQWGVSRYVAALERSGGEAFDLFTVSRWHTAWFEAVYCGVLVDSPAEFQLDLLSRIAILISRTPWNGTTEGVRAFLDGLSHDIAEDDIAERLGIEKGQGGGVSLGGLAVCENGYLVAFRLGRFRVVVDGKEVLPEQTYYREELERGGRITHDLVPLLQAPARCLPGSRLEPADFLELKMGPQVVEVFHAEDMVPDSDEKKRISLVARWPTPWMYGGA